MARDGSGNYALPAGNPVVTGTTISSTWANATMPDVATALTNSIAKDGQTTPTASLPMGGNKHTGVADGNLGTQYASINQTQNGSLIKVGSVANATDAFTGSITPAIAGYTDGLFVTMTPSVTTTTTSPTLALNGLTPKPIQKEGGVACAVADLVLNVPVHLQYTTQSSGYWMLLNPQVITGSRVKLIPDTSLSANVPLLNGANTFTNTNTYNPASGIALRVNGINSTLPVYLIGGAGTGVSFGLQIDAGTNASDNALLVRNQTGGTQLFSIRGDGLVSTSTSILCGGSVSGTNLVAATAAASVTVNSTTVTNAALLLLNLNGTSRGRFGVEGTSGGQIVGSTALDVLTLAFGGNIIWSANSGASVQMKLVTSTGQLQIVDEDGTLTDAGFRDLPQVLTAISRTGIASDRGKHIYVSNGSTTQTIPSNASVPYKIGASLTWIAATGAGTNTTIAINSDTLVFAVNNTTGSRTLAPGGMFTAVKVAATVWHGSGAGAS